MQPRKDIAGILETAGDPPVARLRAIAAMRSELDRLEQDEVAAAVRQGLSWSRVGQALGVTRQAAHKKHSPQVRENGNGRDRRVAVAPDVREAMRCAREEAALMGAGAVGTQHILLGLLRVDGRAADALRACGLELAAVRKAAKTLEPSRPAPRRGAQPGLSALVREVLEQTLREAIARGDRELRTEHMVFAVLRDEGGGAARTLARLDVSPSTIRTELEWTR